MEPDDLLCSRNAHDKNVLFDARNRGSTRIPFENEAKDWEDAPAKGLLVTLLRE